MDFNIDPEAGVEAGQYSGIGGTEPSNVGTGEGMATFNFEDFTPDSFLRKRKQPQMQRMDYYQQLGQQLRSALQEPEMGGGGSLTAGFDQQWLNTQTNAASANGAHL